MEQSTEYMVNQQANFCNLSWLGGIIDGEGCITINKRSGKESGNHCVSPLITIVNTDYLLTDKVEDILRANNIAFYIHIHPPVKKWREKREIIISGYKRVKRFLELIHPFLINKKLRATLTLEFCNSRLPKSTQPYSLHEKELCQKIWDLNGRGTTLWKL